MSSEEPVEVDVFESDDDLQTQAEEEGSESTPSPTDPDWSDFVMSQFGSKRELVDIEGEKYPNVAGLRRVTELLLGPIFVSRVVRYDKFDGERATVQYEVQLADGRMVSDVADVAANNCDSMFFEKYALTTAATRGEGRCLRKLLRLRVACADEIERKPTPTESVRPDVDNSNRITEQQVTFIDNRCRAMDINVMKFLNMGEANFSKVDEVSPDVAKKMVKKLNDYMNDSQTIPESIKGYNSSWRK